MVARPAADSEKMTAKRGRDGLASGMCRELPKLTVRSGPTGGPAGARGGRDRPGDHAQVSAEQVGRRPGRLADGPRREPAKDQLAVGT